MLRTALKPRWLALLALVVAIIATFTMLGLWQMDVARSSTAQDAAREAAARPAVPLTQVARPHSALTADAVGRTVTASGRYQPGGQLYVTPRRLGDRTGVWVVTPLRVDDTGAVIPVLRGFASAVEQAPAAPDGPVRIVGMLAPSESPPDRPVALPPGQMAKLDLSVLVNQWPGDLYNGFVFLTEQSPPAAATTQLTLVPPPVLGSGGVAWRNLAYALQWWLFAAFAVYMWWRMVRDDHASSLAEATPAAPVDGDPPGTASAPTQLTSSPSAHQEKGVRT